MRISDWSSDVCSSDLRIATFDAMVHLGLSQLIYIAGGCYADRGCIAEGAVGEINEWIGVLADIISGLTAMGTSISKCHSHCSQGLAGLNQHRQRNGVRFRFHFHDIPLLHARSAEPTSELQ